ncbi:MAG: M67 family peptidase [Nitrospirae bacterium]|nr:MAG: M67 family peptidase [Nitrospirota bacterium]
MSLLKIPRQILDEMVAHARALDPYECCGLLAGTDGAVSRHYRITNTVAKDAQAVEVFDAANVKQLADLSEAQKAEVAYFMDPKEMLAAFKDMRERSLDLAVIYHSHTHSPAYPSMTDVGLALYPDAAYLIISLELKAAPDLRMYSIKGQQVTQIEFQAI